MKTVLVLIAIFIFSSAYSQELNVGVMIGPGALALDSKMITFGTTVEYKPTKAMLSFNIDPFLVSLPDKLIFTAPVYLKFIFGNQNLSLLRKGFFCHQATNTPSFTKK